MLNKGAEASTKQLERTRFPTFLPQAAVGVSFKHEHLPEILVRRGVPRLFFEVHAENYMGAGGRPHQALRSLRRDHPITLHGVAMSIGGPGRLDDEHLERFRNLVNLYEPALVSEHLAWPTHDGAYLSDLLPVP